MLHAYSTGAPVPRRVASPFIIRRQSCHGYTLDSILIMEDTERGFLHSEDGAVARRTFYLPSPQLSSTGWEERLGTCMVGTNGLWCFVLYLV